MNMSKRMYTSEYDFMFTYLYQRTYKWVFCIWMKLYFYLFVLCYFFLKHLIANIDYQCPTYLSAFLFTHLYQDETNDITYIFASSEIPDWGP